MTDPSFIFRIKKIKNVSSFSYKKKEFRVSSLLSSSYVRVMSASAHVSPPHVPAFWSALPQHVRSVSPRPRPVPPPRSCVPRVRIVSTYFGPHANLGLSCPPSTMHFPSLARPILRVGGSATPPPTSPATANRSPSPFFLPHPAKVFQRTY